VELLREWIAKEAFVATEIPTDLDPPNMPE
jgi:hypothetical protein